jgi:hypothetical protein
MKMIVQETTEKAKRIKRTNRTIRPAWMIIWTTSLPKAASKEIALGSRKYDDCVIRFIP